MTALCEIAVVAHPTRAQLVRQVATQTGAAALSWDVHNVGAARNHQQAWEYLTSSPSSWAVILEDDAVPCVQFRSQLGHMLTACPGDIVSLYLGRGRPDQWQLPISSVISQDVCFLRADELLHGVGYAVRTALLAPMLKVTRKALGHSRGRAELMTLISTWARKNDQPIYYCRPSIVDHQDGPPVIADNNREDGQSRALPPDPMGTAIRRAWLLGTRDDWDSSCAVLPRPDLRRGDKVARHLLAVR